MDCQPALQEESDSSVLELLDRVLNAGVVLVGDVTITVADIELIYLRLQLLVCSAETARQADWASVMSARQPVLNPPAEFTSGGDHAW